MGAREKLDDYSTFGDITIPLPFNLSLFGGVRYTYDKKDTDQTESVQVSLAGPPNFGKPYTPPLNIPGSTCYGDRTTLDFHNVSYRVGMGWALQMKRLISMLNIPPAIMLADTTTTVAATTSSQIRKTIGTVEGGVKGKVL